MSGYRLPAVPPCEIPDCEVCWELAAAMDADVAARLRVLVAAEKADRKHALAGKPSPQHAQGGKS